MQAQAIAIPSWERLEVAITRPRGEARGTGGALGKVGPRGPGVCRGKEAFLRPDPPQGTGGAMHVMAGFRSRGTWMLPIPVGTETFPQASVAPMSRP